MRFLPFGRSTLWDGACRLRRLPTAPEGASYDYMARYMDDLVTMVQEEVPVKVCHMVPKTITCRVPDSKGCGGCR